MLLRHFSKVEVCGSVFLTGSSGQGGFDKAGFSVQSKRAPFKKLVVGSSRNPGHPRAPIWRGRLLSNEALRAVQELKRAQARKDDAHLSNVLKSKVARLLKFDMLAVLTELRRQNECDLALLVFDVVQKEFWYKAEEGLFSDLVTTLARNKRIKDVEKLYALASAEGVQPSMDFYTDLLSAQVGAGNLEKAIDAYDELRKAGYAPCNPAFSILRKALKENGGFEELVATLEKEFSEACGQDVDVPQEDEVDIMRGHNVDAPQEDEADIRHTVFS